MHIFVMFGRRKSSVRNSPAYEYLQIARSYREGGKSANRQLPAWSAATA
jgi:hypothetical protein